MQRALVIIPTVNEIENIERLAIEVLAQKASGFELEVLVVDDASTDGTSQAIDRLGRSDPRVHLLSRDKKYGLGTAYIAGFRYALERDYDLAATMDADFSHAPCHIPEMLALIAQADVVIGSRYIPGGGIRNWGIHRHILSGTANFLARGIGGLKPRDCTTGFRLYRAEFLRKLDFDRITSHGYSCLMELVFVCQRAGARIKESPIIFVDRRAGQSKISRGEIFKAFKTLWLLAKLRWGARAQ